MIYINLKDNPPNKEWLDKADAITRELLAEPNSEKRKEIIDRNAKLWGEIKGHLLSLSHQKCWYSEAKESYSYYHVDHFRPKKRALDLKNGDKGGYWWLAFDWTNYRICGSVGNSKKGDRFCVKRNKANDPSAPLEDEVFFFLDPIDEDDPMHLNFDENGGIKPLSVNADHWDYLRATYTIENLNLNYPALRDARRDLWMNLVLKIREIQNLMDQNNTNPSATIKNSIKEKLKTLKELVQPASEFSATAKACLFSSGLRWAMSMAA